MRTGEGEEGNTLVGVARAHADVSDVAGLDDVVQSLHLRGGQRLSLEAGQRRAAYRLFNRRVVVKLMAFPKILAGRACNGGS